jgi:DNA-binding Lrp family transcriptional regulator
MDVEALHGGDLLVLLKMAAARGAEQPLRALAGELGVSKSGIAQSIARLLALGLLKEEGGVRRINRLQVRDCLEHGVRWLAPASIGDWELGLPTAHAAEPLSSKLKGGGDPLVMPLAHGPVRGRCVAPIHPKAPQAAQKDPRLHRLLAIVDAFRVGRARDREVAAHELAACL